MISKSVTPDLKRGPKNTWSFEGSALIKIFKLSKNDHHHRKVTPDLKKYHVVLRKWFFILKSAWPKVTKRETLIKSHQTSLSRTTPCYSDSRSKFLLPHHFPKNHQNPHLLLDIISILTQDNILSISILLQRHTPPKQPPPNPHKPQNQS